MPPAHHFTITRNGRADGMPISVAEYGSMGKTLDILAEPGDGRGPGGYLHLRRCDELSAEARPVITGCRTEA